MNNPSEHFGDAAIKGYKQPPELVARRRQTLTKNHPKYRAVLCASCGAVLQRVTARARSGNCYCNGKCQMDYEYKNGIRDPYLTTMKSHEATRELVSNGIHPFQRPEVHIKAQKECGHRNYGRTWLEERMGWALNKVGIKFESQYPVKHGVDSLNRPRYYFSDFAIPEESLLIECDGSYWHSENKDRGRQDKLERLGWKIIRFTDTEINNNLIGCANKVKSRTAVAFGSP